LASRENTYPYPPFLKLVPRCGDAPTQKGGGSCNKHFRIDSDVRAAALHKRLLILFPLLRKKRNQFLKGVWANLPVLKEYGERPVQRKWADAEFRYQW